MEAAARDAATEGDELDDLVAPLTAEGWATATPADGWSVRTTIAHLHVSDEAGLASTRGDDLTPYIPAILEPAFDGSDAELLAAWRAGRAALQTAVLAVPDGQKLPWFGPPMSPIAFFTARLMETWAHGQDIADALGVRRAPTARLRHVCEIGFRTRAWSYTVAERVPPDVAVRVALTAPDGSIWTWGPEDAPERVTGSAHDFALLVTQRRHRDDLALAADGPAADEWLAIAQAYAGFPGTGRPAGLPAA
ncbi:MAG TPA: TIGR03084 family metal-binding protein [Mycobacteriales bacterium]|nr:TIGR03084 family metal-binding protein [Mycobacteriales bacterium]